MQLRTRFMLILAIFTVIMVISAVWVAQIILSKSALQADDARARVLIERGQTVLAEEIEVFSATVEDWSSWDDTYDFMKSRDPRYKAANLVKGTLDTLRLHLLAFYDTQQQLVFGISQGTDGNMIETAPPNVPSFNGLIGAVMRYAKGAARCGYVAQGSNLWLIGTAPIRTSDDKGPSRGMVVMARYLDEAERARLARLIDPSATLVSAAQGWPPGHVNIHANSLRSLRAASALADIFGNGRLALELDIPRTAYDQITLSLLYVTAWIVACGMGLWLISVWLLDRWVLRSVTASVSTLRNGLMAAANTLDRRPPLQKIRDDEIGELTEAVEAALKAVETSARETDRRRTEAIHSQRLAALGTLAAGIAHEINNPNGIIHLNLNVLRRELERLCERVRPSVSRHEREAIDAMEQGEKELNTIILETLSASERIEGIVAALKNFAQPVADTDKTRISVADALDEASRWLRHEYRRSGCRLRQDLEPNLPAVWGQRQQVVQVFVNLLQNACQAASKPNATVHVSASSDRTEAQVTIVIADDGKGMPPEDIEHALDPFFTTRRGEGGMGLGLSISAAIVKSHGGRLHLESRVDKGTQVTVTLPIAGSEAPHAS